MSAICLTMLVLFAGCGGGGGSSSDDSVDGATVETLSFVAADFNGSTIYEIWEDSAGILGTGGWDGTTLQFAAGGTAAGSEGIVDPFVAEMTATWEIDPQGRLYLLGSGHNNFYTLRARTANRFDVCWGATASEADSV